MNGYLFNENPAIRVIGKYPGVANPGIINMQPYQCEMMLRLIDFPAELNGHHYDFAVITGFVKGYEQDPLTRQSAKVDAIKVPVNTGLAIFLQIRAALGLAPPREADATQPTVELRSCVPCYLKPRPSSKLLLYTFQGGKRHGAVVPLA